MDYQQPPPGYGMPMQQPMQQPMGQPGHRPGQGPPGYSPPGLSLFTQPGAPPQILMLAGFGLMALGILLRALVPIASVEILGKIGNLILAPGIIVSAWYVLGTGLRVEGMAPATKVALIFAGVLLIWTAIVTSGTGLPIP